MTDGARGRLRANDAGTQGCAWFAIANPSGPLSAPSIHLRILRPWVRAAAAPCTASTSPSSGREASFHWNALSPWCKRSLTHSHDGPGAIGLPSVRCRYSVPETLVWSTCHLTGAGPFNLACSKILRARNPPSRPCRGKGPVVAAWNSAREGGSPVWPLGPRCQKDRQNEAAGPDSQTLSGPGRLSEPSKTSFEADSGGGTG